MGAGAGAGDWACSTGGAPLGAPGSRGGARGAQPVRRGGSAAARGPRAAFCLQAGGAAGPPGRANACGGGAGAGVGRVGRAQQGGPGVCSLRGGDGALTAGVPGLAGASAGAEPATGAGLFDAGASGHEPLAGSVGAAGDHRLAVHSCELRVLHVGLELLREDVAQLLHREPLHDEGPQPRQVHGAVGPDREGAAEIRDVEQLHLHAVARAKIVGVVDDAAALQRIGARGPGRQRLRGLHSGRCSWQQRCSHATDRLGTPQASLNSGVNLWPADAGLPPLLPWQLAMRISHKRLSGAAAGQGFGAADRLRGVGDYVLAKGGAGALLAPRRARGRSYAHGRHHLREGGGVDGGMASPLN